MSVVRFDQVSKRFSLHKQRSRSFQELFLSTIHRRRRPAPEEFWALRDVSFAVERGEMVGLIGANGAGKSTALKLISRIIEPTSGHVEVNGRVGALLELGTGFHPELTGRENIYLSGSFSGFGRQAIDRMVDDIIDFSEIERFIDVPVKHYSSGMYVRLGFAVAIQFEPDLLLVDEVLAVGDQSFQERCPDRIFHLRRQGVSIIFVTHALGLVQDLCDRAILLSQGQIQAQGAVDSVLDEYASLVAAHDAAVATHGEQKKAEGAPQPGTASASRWGSGEAEIVAVQILNAKGREQHTFRTGDSLTIRMHYLAHEAIQRPRFGLALYHSSGFHVSGPNNVFSDYPIPQIEGTGYVDYTIDQLPLLQGLFEVSVAIYDYHGNHAYDHIHKQSEFRVRAGGVAERFGTVYIPSRWHWSPTQALDASDRPSP